MRWPRHRPVPVREPAERLGRDRRDSGSSTAGYGPRRDHGGSDHGSARARGVTFAAVELPELRDDPVVTGDRARSCRRTVGARAPCTATRAAPSVRAVPRASRLDHALAHDPRRRDQQLRARRARAVSHGTGSTTTPAIWRQGGTRRLQAVVPTTRSAGHAVGRRRTAPRSSPRSRLRSNESSPDTSCAVGRSRRSARSSPATLTEQGKPGNEVYLVLDGVLAVDVDGKPLNEFGPGAILGERAVLEGGNRTVDAACGHAVPGCRRAGRSTRPVGARGDQPGVTAASTRAVKVLFCGVRGSTPSPGPEFAPSVATRHASRLAPDDGPWSLGARRRNGIPPLDRAPRWSCILGHLAAHPSSLGPSSRACPSSGPATATTRASTCVIPDQEGPSGSTCSVAG